MLPGVALCCALAVAGDAAARATGSPVPGAILGFGVYLLWLASGRGIGWSRPGAALLIRWIGAMIVPALVGLGGYAAVLGGVAVQLAGVLVVSTLVTALATAGLYRLAGGRG
jgi:putative effector of murein hydrolase LrgA (UPF0299 family)